MFALHRGVVAALRARDTACIDELRTRQRRRSRVPTLADVDELAVVAGQRVAEVLAPADVDGRRRPWGRGVGRRAGRRATTPGVRRACAGLAAPRGCRTSRPWPPASHPRDTASSHTSACNPSGSGHRPAEIYAPPSSSRHRGPTATRRPRRRSPRSRPRPPPLRRARERSSAARRRRARPPLVRFSRRFRRVAVNDRDRREGLGNALQAERADIRESATLAGSRPASARRRSRRLARCRGSFESRRLDDRHAGKLTAVLRDLAGTDADAQLRRIIGVECRDSVMYFARALHGVRDVAGTPP